jgi:putative endonuclease
VGSWQVYIARCADGTLYTGIARDVERRIAEHNAGKGTAANYTRSRRPVVLVYSEPAESRSAASKREYRIKQLSRAEKLVLASGVRAAGTQQD